MFREVDLHFAFIGLSSKMQMAINWLDCKMTRLTFGVTSSPFLATQVLRQLALNYRGEFPRAAQIVGQLFYTDDCLAGADKVEQASNMRKELNALLAKGKMVLQK